MNIKAAVVTGVLILTVLLTFLQGQIRTYLETRRKGREIGPLEGKTWKDNREQAKAALSALEANNLQSTNQPFVQMLAVMQYYLRAGDRRNFWSDFGVSFGFTLLGVFLGAAASYILTTH